MIGVPIEMPRTCEYCPMMGTILLRGTKYCKVMKYERLGDANKAIAKKPDWCPLIDIDRQEDDLK